MDLLIISKLLGTVTMVMCSGMKLPQVWNIFRSRSALGVSLSSLALELTCYTVGSLYGFRRGYPFTTYGELVILLLQDLALLAMVVHYEGMLSATVIAAFIAYLSFGAVTVTGILPLSILQIVFSFNLPISIVSKLAQIRTLVSAGTAGQISLTTWIIALLGCVFRIFTTLVETQDMIVLSNYASGVFFNVIVVGLIIYYQGKDRKKKL